MAVTAFGDLPLADRDRGSRGGVDLPEKDVDRVRSHLARYYAKMDDTAPWERD
jgi:hypothetical protein